MQPNFEVLVGLYHAGQVKHFYRDNSRNPGAAGYPWIETNEGFPLIVDPDTCVSLILSSYGNLEAVVTNRGMAQHYWRDQPGQWHPADVIEATRVGAGDPPSLIESTWRTGDHGNFELLLPLDDAVTGQSYIAHYYRDNSPTRGMQWHYVDQFGPADTAALIQSDYGPLPSDGQLVGGPGNLKCVAVTPSGELVHYWRDPDPNHVGWNKTQQAITSPDGSGQADADKKLVNPGADGSPGFVQPLAGRYGSVRHGNFEVVAPTSGDAGTLAHYYRDNSPAGGMKWHCTTEFGNGDWATLIASTFGALELLTGGLNHWWRPLAGGNWSQSAGGQFAPDSTGIAGFIQDLQQQPPPR